MPKLKIASYWAAACGGCDTAILDTHEKILDIAAAADIVFWPIAVDGKSTDASSFPVALSYATSRGPPRLPPAVSA